MLPFAIILSLVAVLAFPVGMLLRARLTQPADNLADQGADGDSRLAEIINEGRK